MVVQFTQRVTIPGQATYMAREVVTLRDDVASDFIDRGLAVAVLPPVEPITVRNDTSPTVKDVAAPPVDKMVKTGHRK